MAVCVWCYGCTIDRVGTWLYYLVFRLYMMMAAVWVRCTSWGLSLLLVSRIDDSRLTVVSTCLGLRVVCLFDAATILILSLDDVFIAVSEVTRLIVLLNLLVLWQLLAVVMSMSAT